MANDLHKPACLTCGGSGWIGGPSFYAPDEGGEECPDCALTAPVATEQAQAVAKWIDDPHDIEQGQMLNPAWLAHHGLTSNEALATQMGEPAPTTNAERVSSLKRLIGSAVNYPTTARSRSWVTEVFGMIDALAASPEAAPAAMMGEWTSPTVEQVERELWISHFEWHEANPNDIISAVLRLATPPAATPAAPCAAPAEELVVAAKEAVRWLNSWFRNHDGNKIADALSAALAQPAPVQQDAPAPSMVGDAKGGA